MGLDGIRSKKGWNGTGQEGTVQNGRDKTGWDASGNRMGWNGTDGTGEDGTGWNGPRQEQSGWKWTGGTGRHGTRRDNTGRLRRDEGETEGTPWPKNDTISRAEDEEQREWDTRNTWGEESVGDSEGRRIKDTDWS